MDVSAMIGFSLSAIFMSRNTSPSMALALMKFSNAKRQFVQWASSSCLFSGLYVWWFHMSVENL